MKALPLKTLACLMVASVVWAGDLLSFDSEGNAKLYGNLSMGNVLQCTRPGSPLWIAGNRTAGDTTADIYLSPSVARLAGNIVEVWNGMPVASVSKDGQVTAGAVGASLNAPAAFVDGTGVSGHVSLTCSEGLYTVIAGKLGKNLIDGVYPYGGLHGDTSFVSTYPREAGLLLQALSNSTAGAAFKFYVDYNGGIGQAHGLALAQFGHAGWIPQSTSVGTNYSGQGESSLMYAFDTHHWYSAGAGVWREIPFVGDSTKYDSVDGSGIAGCQTINALKGKGKFAAGTSTLKITNARVDANSHVSVVLQTNDATAILKSVVPGAGSFDVNIVACTADTVFSFVVEN